MADVAEILLKGTGPDETYDFYPRRHYVFAFFYYGYNFFLLAECPTLSGSVNSIALPTSHTAAEYNFP